MSAQERILQAQLANSRWAFHCGLLLLLSGAVLSAVAGIPSVLTVALSMAGGLTALLARVRWQWLRRTAQRRDHFGLPPIDRSAVSRYTAAAQRRRVA